MPLRDLFFFLVLNFSILVPLAFGQSTQSYQTKQAHSIATLISENDQLKVGKNWLGLHIELDPEWHTYWLNPGDSASPPNVVLKNPFDVKLTQVHFPSPKRIQVGPLTSFGYEESVVLLVELEIPPQYNVGSEVKIAVDVEWLVCKEECIPGLFTFQRTWKIAPNPEPSQDDALMRKFKAQLPEINPLLAEFFVKSHTTHILIPEELKGSILDIFPYRNTVVTNEKPQVYHDSVIFQNSPTAAPSEVETEDFLVTTERGSSVLRAKKVREGLMTMLLFSFIGGLILNLMPCVFPVLTLKAYSVLQQSRQRIFLSNISYVAGVLLSFLVLGGFIAFVRESGQALGWGFQLQSPLFVAFLILLFVFMALFFLDWLPLSLNSLANIGQSWTRGHGFMNSFFTGVLAVLVASPCTAPFMGAAMGYALSQTPQVIFLVFATIGFGLSFPFFLLALFPQVAHWLPKPGRWLLIFKKSMAIPLFATALWLSWVLFLQFRASQPLPIDSAWQSYSKEYLEESKSSGQPVFLNATAAWCISCQVNERLVFQDERVKKFFEEKNFRLIKADWTKKDAEIRALLTKHGRAGVPLYLYFPPNKIRPIILPELLTVDLFLGSVKGL